MTKKFRYDYREPRPLRVGHSEVTVRSALNTPSLPDWSLVLREQSSTEPPPQFKNRGIPTTRAYNHLADDAYHY